MGVNSQVHLSESPLKDAVECSENWYLVVSGYGLGKAGFQADWTKSDELLIGGNFSLIEVQSRVQNFVGRAMTPPPATMFLKPVLPN